MMSPTIGHVGINRIVEPQSDGIIGGGGIWGDVVGLHLVHVSVCSMDENLITGKKGR